jgi:hypothetical protein
MVFTVVFALIGNEIEHINGDSPPATGKSTDGVTSAGRIIIGGTIAATLLTLLSHAGPPGRQAAFGLATITFVTATLVYGGPVWNALASTVGNAPGGIPTTSTTPTTPTQGAVATTAALSNVA